MQDYRLYVILEDKYINLFKGYNKNDLFPSDWYINYNYISKNKILMECIKNKTLIKNIDYKVKKLDKLQDKYYE